MDGNNPKVSFIPKGSLVREESFLERRRPRSAIGYLSIFVFIVVVGAYAALYYYVDLLSKEVGTKRTEIKQAQKLFSDAPQVGEAKLFRVRADLAKELLTAHTVVLPAFSFIEENTVDSIVYDKFSFVQSANGATLEISGEAPSYASLANQEDILRKKTNELSGLLIQNVVLTKFGTVTFILNMAFKPDYLSYTKSTAGNASTEVPTVQISEPIITPVTEVFSPRTADSIIAPEISGETSSPVSSAVAPETPPSASVVSTEKKSTWQTVSSFMNSLWSRFKFW